MEIAYSAFRQKKHATIIDNFNPALVPSGQGSYVTKHLTRDGGQHFDAYWVRYEALGSIVDRVENVDERREFQRRVLNHYHVKMSVLVLKTRMKLVDSKLTRWAEDERGNADVLERKIREGLHQREKMIAAWADAFNGGTLPDIAPPPAEALMRLDQLGEQTKAKPTTRKRGK